MRHILYINSVIDGLHSKFSESSFRLFFVYLIMGKIYLISLVIV